MDLTMTKAVVIRSFGIFSLGVLSSLLVTGCRNIANLQLGSPRQAPPPLIQLTVSAAASLKNAIEAIKPLYQGEHPHTEIIFNFGSSGSLQRQIEQGAPVDIFIAAAVEQMEALEGQGLILPNTRRDLLKNQLVLISPTDSKTKLTINDFQDLGTEEIKIVALGEPESVPAGKYAQEVLNFFQIADQVNSKAVYGKDVRQVLNYVATGNVDAGIVYHTDAQGSDQVKVVATAPDHAHSPVIYPIAVIRDSDYREVATELVEFLGTPTAQAVFEAYGFIPISND
jgi:molybdate transport system substrate-binding protein